FYASNLASPKYIASLVFFVTIPAADVLARSTWRARSLALVAFASLWIVSVSPRGISGPNQGALWYLPTVDGPCPTGSYATFYNRTRRGFYQFKQVDHIDSARAAY